MNLIGTLLKSRGISVRCYSRTNTTRNRRSLKFRLEGFVGDGDTLASQYHSHDFDWNELYATEGYKLEVFDEKGLVANVELDDDEEPWDRFFRLHRAPRFFKERRYLLKEFPHLEQTNPPVNIADLGSGYGSSILPVMKSNPTCTAVAMDISPEALSSLISLSQDYGISKERLTTLRTDISTHPAAGLFIEQTTALQVDFALMVFVLSALDPVYMRNALRNAFDILTPRGRLLFRDYGFCDMTQFRFPQTQRFGRQSYLRQDATRAYYFKIEELHKLCSEAGFVVEECNYVCVLNRNRRTRQEMKRVFVHGVFCKESNS